MLEFKDTVFKIYIQQIKLKRNRIGPRYFALAFFFKEKKTVTWSLGRLN